MRMVFVDEFSMVSQSHLFAINKRCGVVLGQEGQWFGGLHVILVGDPCQHGPPTARVLWFGAAAEAASEAEGTADREARPKGGPVVAPDGARAMGTTGAERPAGAAPGSRGRRRHRSKRRQRGRASDTATVLP